MVQELRQNCIPDVQNVMSSFMNSVHFKLKNCRVVKKLLVFFNDKTFSVWKFEQYQ